MLYIWIPFHSLHFTVSFKYQTHFWKTKTEFFSPGKTHIFHFSPGVYRCKLAFFNVPKTSFHQLEYLNHHAKTRLEPFKTLFLRVQKAFVSRVVSYKNCKANANAKQLQSKFGGVGRAFASDWKAKYLHGNYQR